MTVDGAGLAHSHEVYGQPAGVRSRPCFAECPQPHAGSPAARSGVSSRS